MKPDVPAWAADAVWYQIFVSRFRNGEPANDPPGCKAWSHDWTAAGPDGKAPSIHDLFSARYGGDLQGVIEKLPYLAELGVNTLYLNPIFEAETEHKYDASDYRHVDATFGEPISDFGFRISETTDPASWQWTAADRVFLELIRKAHAAEIRVVIDGVFNHVGQEFWAWKDVLAKGRDSAYADWFEIRDWGPPLRWSAWDGENGRLVRFKQTQNGLVAPVEEHLFAITRRWMDPDGDGDPCDGIDGWRLDAAEQVRHGFWKRWRQVVKSLNPEALIVGEIWTPAGNWLRGDQFDVVTNYQFAVPTVRFFRPGNEAYTPTRFLRDLEQARRNQPWAVTTGMVNLLGSHDTDRIASMMFNPGREYDKESRPGDGKPFYRNGPPDEEALQRAKLATLFQFAYPGAPMIYNGDEWGMPGGDDPYCRAPMWWPDLEATAGPIAGYAQGMKQFHTRLAALRKEHAALRRGDFRLVLADDVRRVLVIERCFGDMRILAAFNGHPDAQRLMLTVGWPGPGVRLIEPLRAQGPQDGGKSRSLEAGGRLTVELEGLSGVFAVPAPVPGSPPG